MKRKKKALKRVKRGFSELDPQSHKGKTTTWLTPLPLIESLGKFDLDPCGYPNHWTAKKLIFPGAKVSCDDGLKAKWRGRVWLNPPYGRGMDMWLGKLQEHGNGIALIFARTDTALFHRIDADMVFFLKGRIAFLDKRKRADTNAGHGSMLIAYGKQNAKAILKSGLAGRAM